MCSVEFMLEVRELKCFCLKYPQVRVRSCYRPPNLKTLTKLLVDVLNSIINEWNEEEVEAIEKLSRLIHHIVKTTNQTVHDK